MASKTFVILFSIVGMFLAGCARTPSASAISEGRPEILATIAPYAKLTQLLVGDAAAVTLLVPPHANVHVYEPPLRQLEQLAHTNLWIRLGEPSETKLVRALQERDRDLTILDLSETTDLLSEAGCCHHHSHSHAWTTDRDLHYWMSPKTILEQLPHLVAALVTQLPEEATAIQGRALQLQMELEQLDAELTVQLAPLRGRSLLISHPSLGYFCRDYGLTQIALEQDGKEPLPDQIHHLLQLDRSHLIPLLVTGESSSHKAAARMSQTWEFPLFSFDPYAEDLCNNLRTLAQALLDASA